MPEHPSTGDNPLRAENERLARDVERLEAELARMRKVHDDLWAHEVYLKARTKMFGGLLAFAAVIGALGLGTLSAWYSRIDSYIESEARQQLGERINASINQRLPDILADIEERTIKQVDERVGERLPDILGQLQSDAAANLATELDDMVSKLRHRAQAQLDELLREQVARSVGEARVDLTQAALSIRADEPAAVDRVPREVEPVVRLPAAVDGGYFVIAGSSPVRADLVGELTRVTNQARARGDAEPQAVFDDLRIAPPIGDNRNHALVVGGPLPHDEAEELRAKARAYGFRDDTFLWPAARAYFETR